MTPKFQIGDRVKAIAFTDCFNKTIPEKSGLIVKSVRLVEPTVPGDTMKPYYRIEAHEAHGLGYVEGAERFFEAEE